MFDNHIQWMDAYKHVHQLDWSCILSGDPWLIFLNVLRHFSSARSALSEILRSVMISQTDFSNRMIFHVTNPICSASDISRGSFTPVHIMYINQMAPEWARNRSISLFLGSLGYDSPSTTENLYPEWIWQPILPGLELKIIWSRALSKSIPLIL